MRLDGRQGEWSDSKSAAFPWALTLARCLQILCYLNIWESERSRTHGHRYGAKGMHSRPTCPALTGPTVDSIGRVKSLTRPLGELKKF